MNTPTSDEADLERLREDYLKQLLDRYETRSKSFRTLLFGFVGFGLLFLLLVLFPFVGLHRQRRLVNDRLGDLPRQAREMEVALAGYQQAAAGFDALRKAIDGGAYELRDAIVLLAQSPAQPSPAQPSPAQQSPAQLRQDRLPQQQALADPCDPVTEPDARMNCRVAAQVRVQFARYEELLESSVLRPIQALPPGASAKPDSGMLRRGLDSLRVAFEARLAATPRFWQRFGGKLDFFGDLRSNVDRFWNTFGFETQRHALETARREVDSLKADIENRKGLLTKREESLTLRLAELDSPLGKLPVGLHEAVQLFPLLMAIGFVWCSSVLLELAALRRALYEGYRRRDPEQAALTDRHLALIAPLWIDPGDTPPQDRAARLVLVAPIVIFLLGSALVISHWIEWTDPDGPSALDRWPYGALYVLATLGLYFAWRRVREVARDVRSGSAAQRR